MNVQGGLGYVVAEVSEWDLAEMESWGDVDGLQHIVYLLTQPIKQAASPPAIAPTRR